MEKPIVCMGQGPNQYGLNEDGLFIRVKRGRAHEWEPVRRWLSSEEHRKVREACNRHPKYAYFLFTCFDLRGDLKNEEMGQSVLEKMLSQSLLSPDSK